MKYKFLINMVLKSKPMYIQRNKKENGHENSLYPFSCRLDTGEEKVNEQ